MHASVGISIRPLLITTSSAANASVGSFSKWATISLSRPWSNANRTGISCSWTGAVQSDARDGRTERLHQLAGDRRSTRWGWSRPNHGPGLGLSDFAAEGRDVVVRARGRGFLTELQKIKDEKEIGSPVEFESPLKIVLYPDPRLRNKNKRVTVFDEKLQQLVQEMFDIMYNTDGVGLAAPQVGVNVQLMLYNPEGERGQGAEYILVNPKIVKYSKQRDVFKEGCLSFSHLEANVERPLNVRVEAQDIKGKKFAISLKGWQARIFQHEYDHLEGILYHDRMIPAEIDTIRAGLVKLEEEYEEKTGQPAPEKVSRVGI